MEKGEEPMKKRMSGSMVVLWMTLLGSCWSGATLGQEPGMMARPVDALNNSSHQILIGYDGGVLYFSEVDYGGGRDVVWLAEGRDFRAERRDDPWSFGEPELSPLHPFVVAGWAELGTVLHVAADAPRGRMVLSIAGANEVDGGASADLYLAHRTEAGWSVPMPLEGLNSQWDELFPNWIGGDLWFSSDRPGGAGGFDVYRSEASEQLREAIRMPEPVNSAGDELAALPIGRGAFVSTNRPGGSGGLDIWWIGEAGGDARMEDRTFALEVIVAGQYVPGIPMLVAERGGPWLRRGETGNDGRFQWTGMAPDAGLQISGELESAGKGAVICHIYEREAETEQSGTEWRRIRTYRFEDGEVFAFDMLPLDKWAAIRLDQGEDASRWPAIENEFTLYFSPNAFDVQQADRTELLAWAALGRQFSDVVLLVRGSTDATGSVGVNAKLRKQRAASVTQVLREWGWPSSRIVVEDGGTGSTQDRSCRVTMQRMR